MVAISLRPYDYIFHRYILKGGDDNGGHQIIAMLLFDYYDFRFKFGDELLFLLLIAFFSLIKLENLVDFNH